MNIADELGDKWVLELTEFDDGWHGQIIFGRGKRGHCGVELTNLEVETMTFDVRPLRFLLGEKVNVRSRR